MILQGSKRYPVQEICLHCSATPTAWMEGKSLDLKFAEIRRWHIEDRKWRDIGYHFVIDRDGSVKAGRDVTEIGAGVMGHNSGVIHICLIGGGTSKATDAFTKNFTPAQDIAVRDLIKRLMKQTTVKRITGHNQYAAKECPGFAVPKWWMG